MNSDYQEETKRPRKSFNFSESEEEAPRKRSKSSELNTEQIVSIYDLVEELQDKEERFYNGIQRQLEVFHISQQGRYEELKRDIYNIKRRLSGEKILKPKYETSRRESFSTGKSPLKSDSSCTGSPEPQPEMERSMPLEKVRSPIRNRNKTKSPFSSARVASLPPPSPSPPPASSLSPPPQPSSSPHTPPSSSLRTPSPPPPPLPPQSERARRKLPKANYEPKLSIEGDDEFKLPPPKYDGSDDEFIPSSSRRDPDDDEPSPHNSPTNRAKKGKSKSRKSSIKGQRKESSKELELISKSIGTPGIAKKETHQSNLLGYWTKGAKDSESPRKTTSSKHSATISRLSSSPSPSPTSPPPSPPPPPPPPPPLLKPVAKWRVEAPKLPVSTD
ncbi:uncharacterized protein H6S33_010290 [Morchella sextelata]|uniref:uncharacterized protein n=1 Tax=Morchella sextelata TaxID=1174677 RepID=UPI001D04AAB7|nr:uncharacterized protein H6S33_010290 [Morchella sextelata]KAH0612238.1 hypothetical protein H6S33_010290 [Morchella sextelata]